MSRKDDMQHGGDNELTRDEAAALEALRSLPSHAPSPELRQRARASFLEGSVGSGSVPTRRPPRRRQVAWFAAFPAAAAMVALFLFAALPTDSWVVVDLHMGAEVTVGGSVPQVGTTLRGGEVKTTPCSEVELELPDKVRLRFLSEATANLPTAPGRWLRKDRELVLTAGEVFGSTGGEPLDFRLHLQTPEANALLTGTTFAVFRTDEATCFCLYSGSIEFWPEGVSQATTLPVGQRVFIYKDGRAPSFEPLTPREQMKLEMMHAVATGEAAGVPPSATDTQSAVDEDQQDNESHTPDGQNDDGDH